MPARIRGHLPNAGRTRGGGAARDVSGRDLLAGSQEGKILWATPEAQKLLSTKLTANADDEFVLPETMPQRLEQAENAKAASKEAMASFPNHEQLRLQYMGE